MRDAGKRGSRGLRGNGREDIKVRNSQRVERAPPRHRLDRGSPSRSFSLLLSLCLTISLLLSLSFAPLVDVQPPSTTPKPPNGGPHDPTPSPTSNSRAVVRALHTHSHTYVSSCPAAALLVLVMVLLLFLLVANLPLYM